ncbi:MAG TPA: DegT/DnrJ/EryC1/StrS family aminotransferase [Conexibacter sp.]|jgi:dTDP-4-amino-4,6-dideoxygalactose transaminase
MSVPLFDTNGPVAPLRAAIDARLAAVLDAGVYILGPEVEAFERELAAYLGARHVVSVANGTDALTVALQALGVGPGDEVIVPSFTFYASAEAIPPTGATPVFCDVDGETMNVTPETVKAALTSRTKAVVAVDLFGNPADVPAIEALGVPVVEDAAQAAGSKLNGRRTAALGTVGTLSFFPSKNLPCFGDGGAVVTDSDEVAELARVYRFHGSRDKVTFERVGWNSRLDEMQAAILRVLLPELDRWCDGRRTGWAHYEHAGLWDLVTPQRATAGATPAWGLQVVRTPHAELLQTALPAAGIGARGYYRTPLHRQQALQPWAEGADARLPVTNELARTHLAIPMSPVLDTAKATEVTTAVRKALAGAGE